MWVEPHLPEVSYTDSLRGKDMPLQHRGLLRPCINRLHHSDLGVNPVVNKISNLPKLSQTQFLHGSFHVLTAGC